MGLTVTGYREAFRSFAIGRLDGGRPRRGVAGGTASYAACWSVSSAWAACSNTVLAVRICENAAFIKNTYY